ncbi:hypothetical protein L1987_17509 [Smallanthus sonchifolius]|uniref:Uncharacterized protein n=1 Tax=Smallanthus sonchifolius TaxID=185202 RepID=A0ACB9IXH5_9ASTR|nr:hypothetical protein L1987_17509 [Smallanthus sonchifolius]
MHTCRVIKVTCPSLSLSPQEKKKTNACAESQKTNCLKAPLPSPLAQPPNFTVSDLQNLTASCFRNEASMCLGNVGWPNGGIKYCSVAAEVVTCSGIVPMVYRNDKISITDFGGVGDGRTLNTKAFNEAVYRIKHLRRRGGTLLYVPPGVYLTQSFNLTSRMTLYLAKGAVIKATQNTADWPLIAPLPSYGRGRERPGGRYMSFIHGEGLHDVRMGQLMAKVGFGGTCGDGEPCNSLDQTLSSSRILEASSSLINVVIRHVTMLAPPGSPNTDGIDPDSSSHVCIEDSYISTGDDLVAVKSGWDEYGINYGRPSTDITIRRVISIRWNSCQK